MDVKGKEAGGWLNRSRQQAAGSWQGGRGQLAEQKLAAGSWPLVEQKPAAGRAAGGSWQNRSWQPAAGSWQLAGGQQAGGGIRRERLQCTVARRRRGLAAPGRSSPMATYFRSFCSSSAGNCLALWTADSSILVDCGLQTQKGMRALLERHRARHGKIHGVLVTHAHGDHVSRAALKVLGGEETPLYCHRDVGRQLRERHEGFDDMGAAVHAFASDSFTVGDFRVSPIALPHQPGVPTFGFVIHAGHGGRRRKVVVCTDFNDFSVMVPHLAGADFVFVEANHDLALLRRHPNPNSRYHLNNVKTAWLLAHAVRDGRRPPNRVVLGHLSAERNTEELAVGEVERVFARQQIHLPFRLQAAPRHEPSRTMKVV